MLQVFASDEDREEVFSQLKQIEGYNCNPSGLTPPTTNIIKRKYLKTRMHKEKPVRHCTLFYVCLFVYSFWMPARAGG